MVCIAAFIVLLMISVPVLVLSIVGKFNARVHSAVTPFWKMFKKAWHCVGRRVTFRACDSSFKDDIKNSVLSRLILKHKKWVKPVSAAIEVASVLIVVVAIWSLVEVGKAGLSIYVYGTCNVVRPEACLLGDGEVCSTEETTKRNFVVGWFTGWGELFAALPARVKAWDAAEFLPDNANFLSYNQNNSVALDILDPGCVNCLKSFNNQLRAGFFEQYNVAVVIYPIRDSESDDGYKFANSYLISSYLEAVRSFKTSDIPAPEWLIIKKLFTEKDEEIGIDYQSAFNGLKGLTGTPYEVEKAETMIKDWLKGFGFNDHEIEQIAARAHSDETRVIIENSHNLVDNIIKTKGIPTTIYDGKRHIGVWRE
ncbi:hypothetical protein FWF93_03220 [Candidatus Saccharibacteria bacterium]|nr:hypothetical protein [Candidatus Saccharibacteria bacterium]